MEEKIKPRLNVVCSILLVVVSVYLVPSNCIPLTEADGSTDLTDVDWWKLGEEELKETLAIPRREQHAKNNILFLGDGMGISTLAAARFYKAQLKNTNLAMTRLAWEDFPYTALTKNVAKVKLGDCEGSKGNEVYSILHHSHRAGKWTGLVSTTRVTDATPGALYAQVANRKWESDAEMEGVEGGCKDIASQLVEDNNFIKVVLAGGRQLFFPENHTDPEYPQDSSKNGRRKDNQNLIQKWKDLQLEKEGVREDAVKFVRNQAEFEKVDSSNVEYLMGLFEPDHMQYESDRTDPEVEAWGEPSVTEMTETAIKVLQRSTDGYFLLVEGGRIDHAHHNNKARKALDDTLALDEAVERAKKMTSPEDTLIVVAADHSHVFTVAAPATGEDLLGLYQDSEGTLSKADDDLPYMPLAYANGPGFIYHRMNGTLEGMVPGRRDLTNDSHANLSGDKDFTYDAPIPLRQEQHGSEDTAVFARGPMQHLFVGTHEQNYIAHALMYASCVGDNIELCDTKSSAGKYYLSSLIIIILLLLHVIKIGL